MKGPSRLGVAFISDFHSVEEILHYSRIAEEAGVESSWVAEHYFYRDAFACLTSVLSQTRRIKAGTCVVNPYTRHPTLLAMTAMTLDEAFPGRIALGVGTSTQNWIDGNLGLGFEKGVPVMRESIELIKTLLRGETVNHNGPRFRARGVRLGRPAPNVPVYLAAVGPRMLQLAGRISDGAILTAGSSPFYVERMAVPNLSAGAKEGGRAFEDIDLASLALVAVSDSPKDAHDALRLQIARLLRRPGRAEQMLSRNLAEEVVGVMSACKEDADAARRLSDQALDEMGISGTRERCIESLAAYFKSGVKLLLLVPVGGERENISRLIDYAGKYYSQ